MLREETALHLALLKVLTDRLGKARTTAADTLKASWRVGDRNAAALPSDAVIGSVTYAKGRASAAVTDREAFEEWVAANHPEEIETVVPEPIVRVRPAYEALLTSAAKQMGEAVDATTGEVVPGIEVRQGDPYTTVRLAGDAEEQVAAAWKSGELAELIGGLLAIESPTSP
jgi:hypothetical protein